MIQINFNLQLTKNFILNEWFKSELEQERFKKLPYNTQNLYLNNIKDVASKLQKFRDYKNKSIKILSGWRSYEHNKLVGGAVNSFHLSGMATDIYYKDIYKEYLKDSLHLHYIFNGLLYYPASRFFHCDIRPVKFVNLNYK